MTADPLAFLNAALDAAERLARATTPVPLPGQWAAVRDKHDERGAPLALIQGRDEHDPDPDREDYSYGVPVIAMSAEWQDEAEANLRHIAANDPSAVLRQIAADRKLIARHRDDGNGKCVECGQGYELSDWGPNAPCDTIRDRAEGWGWTEETT